LVALSTRKNLRNYSLDIPQWSSNMPRRPRISEFPSYAFIKKELVVLGWNTDNPNRNPLGQVYTQQECLDNPLIGNCLGGLKPEYVIKISEEVFWVIEAKATHEQYNEAFGDLKNYCSRFNSSLTIKAPFASLVLGNDHDGYMVTNFFIVGDNFQEINYGGNVLTSLLSSQTVENILETQSPDLTDLEIKEGQLLKTAEEINSTLHSASINKDERASAMASILLSLVDGKEPDHSLNARVYVKNINNKAEDVLISHNKREFFQHIEIKLPNRSDAQEKFKSAVSKTYFQLRRINIRAAMNSGTDVLGKFYEVFLKYGNGAKDIGIVLTPRHITSYFADVLAVEKDDIVYDPTCGTGGFLVAVFDKIRNRQDSDATNNFKKYRLFGVELQPKVAALSVVNMIFRGDGKNNIIDDDCFAQTLERRIINAEPSAEYVTINNASRENSDRRRPITKVLMNPPFALKNRDDKEWKFVDHALDQMQDNGLLFSVLPLPVMLKGGVAKEWRKKLLRFNTLISVITFPDDLFYPVGIHSCGIIVRKGKTHPKNAPVLWARCLKDGRSKKKGKRLEDPRVTNQLEEIKQTLSRFVSNQQTSIKAIPKFLKVTPLDLLDSSFELGAEAYLDEEVPKLEDIARLVDEKIRCLIAYLIKTQTAVALRGYSPACFKVSQTPFVFISKNIQDFFTLKHGDFHSLDALDAGEIPTVSRNTTDQGIVGHFEMPESAKVYSPGLVTVSTTSGDAFVQVHPFAATDNVVICTPRKSYSLETVFFLHLMINLAKWRYSYGRQCYKYKFAKTNIFVPLRTDSRIDETLIEKMIRSHPGWQVVKRFYTEQKTNFKTTHVQTK